MPMVFSTLMAAMYVFFVVWGATLFSPLFMATCLVLTAGSAGALFGLQVSWFFYALVLVFLGGMMILVLYVAALSENEKFSFSPLSMKMSATSMLASLLLWVAVLPPALSCAPLSLLTLLSGPELALWSVLLAYLLMVLVLSVKAAQSHKGTLTKFS